MRSHARWTGEAPAKVNLFLRILAREAGGYHQLETEYQALTLSDTLTLEREAGDGASREPFPVTLQVEGVPPGALGPPEENLVVRAARAFYGEAGVPAPTLLRLGLVKRIPHGAGLGGGSSDAARVLVGLNALEGGPLPLSRLLTLGGALGADVPFFVTGEPRARGWGRGDRLLPLPPLPPASVLLLLPPEGIATPEAYATLARHREARGVEVREGGMVPGARDWAEAASGAANDFEDALAPSHPELALLRGFLLEQGASMALLSGSGSAVFGVFPGADPAPEEFVARIRGLASERVPGARVLLSRTGLPDPGGALPRR